MHPLERSCMRRVNLVNWVFAVLIAVALAQFTSSYLIRSPVKTFSLVTTVLAEENDNGFDERNNDSKKSEQSEKKSKKSEDSKKISWKTALLWLIFIAGAIDVVFLQKDSQIGGRVHSRFNNSTGGDSDENS